MVELKEYKTPDGWNTVDTNITSEEWLQMLKAGDVIKEEYRKWILRFYREPGHQSSCAQMAKKYKVHAQSVNSYMTNCAKAVQKYLNRFTIKSDVAEGDHYISILVKGKTPGKSVDGYIFQIREELCMAIEQYLYDNLLSGFKEKVLPVGLGKNGIDELYKWQVVTDCEGKTDEQVLQRLIRTNLIDNQFDGSATKRLLQIEPEKICRCFALLKGTRDGLQERFNQFKLQTDELTEGRWKYKISDERMAGAFLACADPEQYTFYKYDVYTCLCFYFGVQTQPTRKKLPHFYEMLDALLEQMKKDSELMEFFKRETEGYIQAPLLAAQTIAWYMQDYMNSQSTPTTRFSWVPFIHELAEKLLEYRDNREELLKIFYANDRELTGAYKEEGDDIEDITPFTLLGTLAIGGIPRRTTFAKYYKKAFGLKTAIPSDYDGMPSLYQQQAMFIYGRNKKAYTQCFWDLFESALNSEDITESFNETLKVKGIRIKVTSGLFWIAPDRYFSMDSHNEEYLTKAYGFPSFPSKDKMTAEYYLNLMENIQAKMAKGEIKEKNYLDFSAAAYEFGNASETDNNTDMDYSYYDEITDALRDKKNIILQGAPGTGKTYAIPEIIVRLNEEDIDYSDRDAVMATYQKLIAEKRVVFTTFHQSMDYEDFVEGLKPEVDEDGNVRYVVEDGIFKTICKEASKPIIRNNSIDLNPDATIWKVSLEGTGDNETRRDCLKNGYIRVGYDDAGPLLDGNIGDVSGKIVLDALINKMSEGDIIMSCYSSKTIDAIGIVTGEYEWHEEFKHYKRVRAVRWLAKGINEDIVAINGGKTMTLSTVYRLSSISIDNVVDLLKKHHAAGSTSTEKNTKPYVIVIDEINRGNVSKIFGELITLLEADKRSDGRMPLSVKLPYSKGKDEPDFSIPSNLYLIGTMNTADRSLTQFDYAMRRRFRFITLTYMPELINVAPGYTFREDLFNKVSHLFIKNYDEYIKDPNVRLESADCFSPEFNPTDLWIGPSYFIIKDDDTDTCLYNTLIYELIPILEQYIADGVFVDVDEVNKLIDELKAIAFEPYE